MSTSSFEPVTLDQVLLQLRAGGNMPAALMAIFADEVEDHLRTIYGGLDRIRANHHDLEALADIRRAAHTLKGAAGAVGLEAITRLSHRMEDLLDRLTETRQAVTKPQTQLLLATADRLQELAAGDIDLNTVAGQLVELYQQYACEINGIAQPCFTAQQLETPVNQAAAVNSVSAGKKSAEPEPLITASSDPTGETSSVDGCRVGGAAAANQSTQFLRVPLDRLDELVNLIGEMVINRSAIQQQLTDLDSPVKDIDVALARLRTSLQELDNQFDHHSRLRADRFSSLHQRMTVTASGRLEHELGRDGFDALEFDQYSECQLLARTLSEATNDVVAAASEIRRLKDEIENQVDRQQRLNRASQVSLMQIRMVPISTILSRLERTVRTVSGKLGRPVELELLGGQTELDKTVLEEITDPLLHIIRNAIDHGVEPTPARIAAGKEETARIRIEAVNQGTQVTIRISDDGAGINLDKVRGKAVTQGLICPDQPLTSQELHNLIFLPGLSTADQLTEVSGRGVGMDVVRDAVARLKGTIRVDSRAGSGTTFTIQLPTTLAVIRALLVESQRHAFAIPFPAIKEIQRLNPQAVCHTSQGSMVEVGERTVTLKDLAAHLQITNQSNPFASNKPLLILQQGTDEVAISVDRILGGQDIVIKSLGNHLKRVPGLIGATVRGDGLVIPILDPNDLIGHVAHQPLTTGQRPETRWQSRTKTAMVIDDSISVRRVTTNLLQSDGWQVINAIDGIDALEKLAGLETAPDVFLCDMEMPRMDGIELIRQIRQQNEFAATPIVMVTSRSSEKHRHKAFDVGATDYVVKPFNDQHLLELITQLVQSTRETVNAF